MEYVRVDIYEYIKKGLEAGILIPRQALKFANVMARPGKLGETVISWSVDKQGNEVMERISVVTKDSVTDLPGWVLTKVDASGKVIIDSNGHKNNWVVADSVFKAKYEVNPENPNLFRPKRQPQIFVQIPHNIIFTQGTKEMKIAAGGFVNITNLENMYGVSERDFFGTYIFLENLEKKPPQL